MINIPKYVHVIMFSLLNLICPLILLFCHNSVTSAEWVKVWEDNFDGNSLNENNWNYVEGCDGNF